MGAHFSEGGMAGSHSPFSGLLRDLGSLMVAVAGESVTMVKRSAPEQALKLKKTDEWKLYLEFLKVMFNLADRLSALHVPIQEQPQFMDSLEDTVSHQLRTVLEPALSPDSDEMEIVYTIGRAVAESRERYDRFRFLVTEESKGKEEFFMTFSERVAQMMGASGNGKVLAAAALCASSMVPAMKALFEEATGGAGSVQGRASSAVSDRQTAEQASGGRIGKEIKLISVMSSMEGEEVETRWGLHPRFREDLRPEEAQELTRRMNRVTKILGERYAKVAFSADWKSWHLSGHA
jgi:hypothetical protein